MLKNEIYLKELFACNILVKMDRIKNICYRAKDQKELRINGESFIQKW